MRSFLGTTLILIMAPALTSAQDTSTPFQGDGYLFIGGGDYADGNAHYGISHVGGGGELQLAGGFGVGSELGVMGQPGEGTGLFSIDPFYRFLHAGSKSRIVPFVNGGYTCAFGNRGFTNSNTLLNFGGGIDYWPTKHVGFRLEFRNYLDYGYARTADYPALRVGVVFR